MALSDTRALASGARCPGYGVVEHSPHGAPLERGNLDASHSIHMSIRWIEEFDADTSWMLLVDRIIPPRDNGMLRRIMRVCSALVRFQNLNVTVNRRRSMN